MRKLLILILGFLVSNVNAQELLKEGGFRTSGATTGQTIKWNGSTWNPADDLGATADGVLDSTAFRAYNVATAPKYIIMTDSLRGGIFKRSYGTADQYMIFTDALGRKWERTQYDFVTPEMFGSRGGLSQDSLPLTRAFNWPKKDVLLTRPYYSSGTLTLTESKTIYGNHATLKLKTVLSISTPNIIINASDVRIVDLTVKGLIATQTGEWSAGIQVSGPSNPTNNIVLENLNIRDTRGDGIYIASTSLKRGNVNIINVHTNNIMRNGVTITSGDNIHIDGFTADSVSLLGIDLEPDVVTQVGRNILIENIHVPSIAFGTHEDTLHANITAKNFIIDNSKRGSSVSYVDASSTHKIGITLRGVQNAKFLNGTIKNCKLYGVFFSTNALRPCKDISFENIYLVGNQTTGTDFWVGTEEVSQRVNFKNCEFKGSATYPFFTNLEANWNNCKFTGFGAVVVNTGGVFENCEATVVDRFAYVPGTQIVIRNSTVATGSLITPNSPTPILSGEILNNTLTLSGSLIAGTLKHNIIARDNLINGRYYDLVTSGMTINQNWLVKKTTGAMSITLPKWLGANKEFILVDSVRNGVTTITGDFVGASSFATDGFSSYRFTYSGNVWHPEIASLNTPLSTIRQEGATTNQAIIWDGSAWVPGNPLASVSLNNKQVGYGNPSNILTGNNKLQFDDGNTHLEIGDGSNSEYAIKFKRTNSGITTGEEISLYSNNSPTLQRILGGFSSGELSGTSYAEANPAIDVFVPAARYRMFGRLNVAGSATFNSSNVFPILTMMTNTGYAGINLAYGVDPSTNFHINGNLRVTGTIKDSNNEDGTAGQVLSSTVTGTDWVTPSSGTTTRDSTFGRNSYYTSSYSGKTILNNVFRRGKTGFQTPDTIGSVNISGNYDGVTVKPAIYVSDSTDYVMYLPRDGSADSTADFQMVLRHFDNVSDAGDNSVWGIGYNLSAGGGKLDATKAGASLRIENKYDITSGGGSTPGFEFHLPQVNFKTGSGSNRPLTGWFGHERAFGGYWSFDSDKINFNDYRDGTQRAFWGFHPSSGSARGISFLDSAGIYFYKNNYEGLQMRNFANTNFIRLIKADTDNQVLLGGQNESRVAAYNHLRVTNSGIISNENNNLFLGTTAFPVTSNFESANSNIITMKRSGDPYTAVWSMFGSQFYLQSSAGASPFGLYLDAPQYAFQMRSSGNIGINEANPSQKLHVTGSARVTGAIYDSNNEAGTSGQVLSSTVTGTDWIPAPSGVTDLTVTGTSSPLTLNSSTGTDVTFTAGTNMTLAGTSSNITINNSLTAGTGIAIVGGAISNLGLIGGTGAGGDLSGTYPNPVVDGLQGIGISATTPTTGQVLKYNGSVWIPDTDAGGGGGANLTFSGASTPVALVSDSGTDVNFVDGSGITIAGTSTTLTLNNNLTTGVSGGQTVVGGTASGNSLTISSTTNATKGDILFGTSAYKETTNRLGIGTTSPSATVHVTQAAIASVGSGSGTNAPTLLTVTGTAGGATSAGSGTVSGGNGSSSTITGGAGGAITGTPGTGFGGAGGSITLLGGNGGNGTTFGGTAGFVEIAGGTGGTGTTAGAAGYASMKGGNAGATGNGDGGNVFLVGGIPTGAGSPGHIYLGLSPSLTQRGNVKIGGSSPPTNLLTIGESGTKLGDIGLAGNTSGMVTIRPAAAAGTWTMTLPTDDGTADQYLKTDGAGVLSWATVSSGGYTTIQEEGSGLTARTTLNFAGSTATAADDGTKTNVTFDTDVNALADLSTTGLYVRTGSGTSTTRVLAAGTGISVSDPSGVLGNPTITNLAPDQTVTIASGTAINVTGTYPSFTVNNTQTEVNGVYTGSGTIPNNTNATATDDFTITTVDATGTQSPKFRVVASGTDPGVQVWKVGNDSIQLSFLSGEPFLEAIGTAGNDFWINAVGNDLRLGQGSTGVFTHTTKNVLGGYLAVPYITATANTTVSESTQEVDVIGTSGVITLTFNNTSNLLGSAAKTITVRNRGAFDVTLSRGSQSWEWSDMTGVNTATDRTLAAGEIAVMFWMDDGVTDYYVLHKIQNLPTAKISEQTATTINFDGRATRLYVPTSATTTTINLPEIVASAPTATQVTVGATFEITIDRAVTVTISRSGASDVILAHNYIGSPTSITTTGGTTFSQKFTAIGANTWIVE